jgi:hypothetical protein|tara:strand:- start:3243 stop:3464 length:222 start_codon:yes stop_codon:yes gene_type:complete
MLRRHLKRGNYCKYNCFREETPLPDTNLNAVFQNSAINQIKIQKGGTPQFKKFSINQFGRVLGTGGRPLSNFI